MNPYLVGTLVLPNLHLKEEAVSHWYCIAISWSIKPVIESLTHLFSKDEHITITSHLLIQCRV